MSLRSPVHLRPIGATVVHEGNHSPGVHEHAVRDGNLRVSAEAYPVVLELVGLDEFSRVEKGSRGWGALAVGDAGCGHWQLIVGILTCL